ncbi:GNAT family N-acetyltransferase [Gloeocapsa sp. PCC 73106]|uniref:GNAT family N-acetyltransferase n=1 Tax=Gloeocapsa sp. PCC 73106 TaxID=102232 RepID=UPI0002ACE0AC|nr:N-acetyltransferase [Gloeocapsa sp. PCC 73106]ELR96582.1 putative acetyltransferase [Gloeocapsa sp. PCC 73106]
MFNIQREDPNDGVYSLLKQAFSREAEANLVKILHSNRIICLSLIAFYNKQVVGYIAFSPVTIGTVNYDIKAVGLAPLAVLPSYQRQGIGSKLVETGLDELISSGYDAVVVLGKPEFYDRFGFEQASLYGIHYSPDIPERYFMVKTLHPDVLLGKSGVVKYSPEFGQI